jgi:hypothetical protein
VEAFEPSDDSTLILEVLMDIREYVERIIDLLEDDDGEESEEDT